MPEPEGKKGAQLRLVGVRVDSRTHAIFAMAAAAYDLSVQDLLEPVLVEEGRRLSAIPEIQTMVKAAERLRARGR